MIIISVKIYNLDAIVLKSRDMREADKILTLFSLQRGKQRVVAHGVAKPKSTKRGAVQPFCYSSLLMHKGRDLDSISQAELKESFTELRNDLDRLAFAAQMAELADGFTEECEPNQAIFALLLSTLHVIAKGDAELALRFFEARLLALSGFLPELDSCSECGQPLKEAKVNFEQQLGGFVCRECISATGVKATFNRGSLEVLKTLYRWDLSKLHQLKVSDIIRKELKGLLRAYIEYHLEKRLKTAEFLDRLYKNKY
ncbi:DNA repair protein RecO [Desulforamulus aquiferis]|uniref:DNA repair protein RecO n=1 Tax=Desulforamulus aquiferis TaxID=1397668 RepID=A0AAW7ZFQ7_9FIRM|nr:DNA repair protein RecO [Desulforamulus aquiferis]MDO7788221.1 DNA repair protein RecO [Desulforamulus aquiferis]